MKISKLIIAFIMAPALAFSQAQINLIGTSYNTNSGYVDIIRWQALDSNSLTSNQSMLQSYLLGSSVFDAYNSNYFLRGFDTVSNGLYTLNTISNVENFINIGPFYNGGSEIDMSTGKIYNLAPDVSGYFNIIEYDLNSGTDVILGVIPESITMGVIADNTCFDSNNALFYFLGYDSTGTHCIYTIDLSNALFSYSKTPLQLLAPVNIFQNVNYDNVNNLIFAMNIAYDTINNTQANNVVEINPGSGALNVRGTINGYMQFQGGASSFDQASGSLVFIGIDNNLIRSMIVFNTNTNTYLTGYVPQTAGEIECDNYAFAKNTYGSTSIDEATVNGLTLYPNPATNNFTLQFDQREDNASLKIFSADGKECFSEILSKPITNINTQSFRKGFYTVRISTEKTNRVLKLIVQ